MKVLFGAGRRDGIKTSCKMPDSRSLYLTLNFVFQLGPEATYARWTEQAVRVNEEKKNQNKTWKQMFFFFIEKHLLTSSSS